MSDLYAKIDNSSLLMFLFYPRRQHGKPPEDAFDLKVPVDDGISITCRAYRGRDQMPWILYFHGNGEVVSDYDAIAPLYNRRGLNLLVADYRGYGASDGKPTFTDMIGDAKLILDYVSSEKQGIGDRGGWYVMGRSLGSISALELAANYPEKIKGLIIESGFISVAGLIRHLGLPSPGGLDLLEEEYRRLTGQIRQPALVIHGERDRLVPYEQGRELFDSLGSGNKEMVVIPGADHNDIMYVDSEKYLEAVEKFISASQGLPD